MIRCSVQVELTAMRTALPLSYLLRMSASLHSATLSAISELRSADTEASLLQLEC